ncbi:MAG: DUF177 domain-containing protein [Rhodobacteraceae bacterium]|nr:DUF177 domain-containing protein [Paracoccaceae bacterium]
MTASAQTDHILRVADLNERRPTLFELQPDLAQLRQIADELGLISLKKLRFKGTLSVQGKREWVLSATLGATVQQECVVTLAPVTTRIDTPISRRFVPETQIRGETQDSDGIEMHADDTLEPLGHSFDFWTIMIEALALALPDYPRADDAALNQVAFADKGIAPMTDDDVKPFAGLAALKEKMQKDDGNS